MASSLKPGGAALSGVGKRLLTSSPVMKRANTAVVPDEQKEKGRLVRRNSESSIGMKTFEEMPGPKGYPVIGTLWDYMKKDGFRFNYMFKAMETRAKEFGPVYKEKIANRTSVIVTDPMEYAKVMRAEGKYPHRMEMEPMKYYRLKRGLSLGTVNSQGEEWHRHRTVLSKKMLRPKEVSEYAPAMSHVADDFIKRLHDITTKNGIPKNLEFELFKWALESIGILLFEERLGCFNKPPSERAQAFLKNLVGFFRNMQPLMYDVPLYKVYPTARWREYQGFADQVHDLGLEFVNKKVESMKRKMENPEDNASEGGSAFLTYLLENRSLTPTEANSHAVDLMMGGVETTSNATLWLLYCLARFPEAQETLHQEICDIMPQRGTITSSELGGLRYAKACLKEVFRLYPITFATSRIIAEEMELGGYHVPAGMHVQANLYGMGHDETMFPDAECFQPERWLRGEDEKLAILSFTNLPWGHGARMCLGRRIAEQEIYIIISKIIQSFRVEYHGEPVFPVLNTVMTPDRPVKLTFVPRDREETNLKANQ